MTFGITWLFWFLPLMVDLPKDIFLGCVLIGGCGPLIAGHVITLINSGLNVSIHSKVIFIVVFLLTAITLGVRIYFAGNGISDINGIVPKPGEITFIALALYIILCLILGVNASNATNKSLNENYIKSFLFDSTKLKWYLFALLFLPAASLLSYFVAVLAGMETTDFMIRIDPFWLLGFFSTFFFFGGNEEFGWRGFLQKEGQKKYSPLVFVLIVTFLWTIWHLPLNYNGVYSTGGIGDLIPRFIIILPISVIFTWAYNKSRYSILTVVLLHAMTNNFDKGFGQSQILFLILLVLFCIYCILDDRMWRIKSYHSMYQNQNS